MLPVWQQLPLVTRQRLWIIASNELKCNQSAGVIAEDARWFHLRHPLLAKVYLKSWRLDFLTPAQPSYVLACNPRNHSCWSMMYSTDLLCSDVTWAETNYTQKKHCLSITVFYEPIVYMSQYPTVIIDQHFNPVWGVWQKGYFTILRDIFSTHNEYHVFLRIDKSKQFHSTFKVPKLNTMIFNQFINSLLFSLW